MVFRYKHPQAIIIIGASRNQFKYGNRALRAYRDSGTEVLPVNPKAGAVEDVKAFAAVADLPKGKTTVATIYTPPHVTEKILPALAKYGVKLIFFNPGAETDALVDQARQLKMEPLLACSVRAIGKDPEDYAPPAGYTPPSE